MQRKTLIIGAGSAAQLIIEEATKYDKFKILGMLDDDINKQGLSIKGIQVIGKVDDLHEKIKEMEIDLVIIAIPSAKGTFLKKIVKICSSVKVEYKILPGLYDFFSIIKGIKPLRDVDVIDILRESTLKFDMFEIEKSFAGKVVLVTGAAGSIGSEICRQILRLDVNSIILLENDETSLFELNLELTKYFPNKKMFFPLFPLYS